MIETPKDANGNKETQVCRQNIVQAGAREAQHGDGPREKRHDSVVGALFLHFLHPISAWKVYLSRAVRDERQGRGRSTGAGTGRSPALWFMPWIVGRKAGICSETIGRKRGGRPFRLLQREKAVDIDSFCTVE
jgi:hypothetical protein